MEEILARPPQETELTVCFVVVVFNFVLTQQVWLSLLPAHNGYCEGERATSKNRRDALA